MPVPTIEWSDGVLRIIDQTLLPAEFLQIELNTLESVWEAIKSLRVRGAPAIGVAAAFGVLVGIREKNPTTLDEFSAALTESADYLATSRPTAVNLFWALDRMRTAGASEFPDTATAMKHLEREAIEIWNEDKTRCRELGAHGASIIQEGDGVLTHCNAGGLATADYGTALAVMFKAHDAGTRFQAFACETRPLLQGARLTAWELQRAGIDVTLICDSMAAKVMQEGRVQHVIVGADRIASNGDAANKIGTYALAVLARAHNVPFYVAAPTSTFDPNLSCGEEIPIELREDSEITHGFGRQSAPDGIAVYNPAFDVTPADLITAFITEFGRIEPPYDTNISSTLDSVAQNA